MHDCKVLLAYTWSNNALYNKYYHVHLQTDTQSFGNYFFFDYFVTFLLDFHSREVPFPFKRSLMFRLGKSCPLFNLLLNYSHARCIPFPEISTNKLCSMFPSFPLFTLRRSIVSLYFDFVMKGNYSAPLDYATSLTIEHLRWGRRAKQFPFPELHPTPPLALISHNVIKFSNFPKWSIKGQWQMPCH